MDQTVTVTGTRQLAERACHMVFGEDASAGPVCHAPKPLLRLLHDWPRDKTAEAIQVALHMPVDFDIGHAMGRSEVKAVVMPVCRVTVLHQGQVVGYAIRTDQLGLNAIKTWTEANEAFQRKIRQAH